MISNQNKSQRHFKNLDALSVVHCFISAEQRLITLMHISSRWELFESHEKQGPEQQKDAPCTIYIMLQKPGLKSLNYFSLMVWIKHFPPLTNVNQSAKGKLFTYPSAHVQTVSHRIYQNTKGKRERIKAADHDFIDFKHKGERIIPPPPLKCWVLSEFDIPVVPTLPSVQARRVARGWSCPGPA